MKLSVREIAIFGVLGAIMYASKLVMEVLPNMHLLGMFIIALTVVYRVKALYPIYTFVLITGLFSGFASWWIPYLYIWTVLWAGAMALPRKMPPKAATAAYMLLGAAHGCLYGCLYAPVQALMFGLSFEGTLAWIAAGLPFDLIHGASNFFTGILVAPLVKVLRQAERIAARS